ncbi:class I SAM-dependent methyltransferase [Chloroflexota bacterium]
MDNEHPTYEQQKSYYDTKWLSHDAKWLNWVKQKMAEHEICIIEFIASSIKKITSKSNNRLKIIDLGCGRGWITDALSKYGDVAGVDLSIIMAERLYPDLQFIQANIVTDEIEGKYDIVISSEVIEHLSFEDQRIYVKKAYDLLNEAGYLVLTTPNKPQVENLVKELSISREQLQPIENWLDKESLSLLLAPYFEIVYIGSTVFRPILIRKYKYLHYIYVFTIMCLKLYKLINRILRSSRQGLYLTIVARKRIPSG